MDFTPDNLRKQFHKLTRDHDKIQEDLQPLRDELDALVAGDTKLTIKEARKREETIRPKIKALQDKLYPIEMERAAVARALGGKTGDPNEE
jgi:ElaB/YqjD/DUF883 family membrane-anchored ribosome-binding protein